MPLYALASKLNFTVESILGKELSHMDACVCGQIFHELYQYYLTGDDPSITKQTNFLFKTGGHMLICGAPKESYNPTKFKSLLRPFPVYVWLIILIAAGLMSVCLAVRSGSSTFTSSLIATLTPLVNQISDPGSASGRFWFSFWVLSVVFLCNWYLGLLESEKIMPVVKEVQGSFRNFQRSNNYTFYTPPSFYRTYENSFGRRLLTEYEHSFGGEGYEDHIVLTSLLRPAWPPDMPPEFFLLKSTCFLSNDYIIQDYKPYLTQQLQQSYVVLQEKFMNLPLWTVFAVPFGQNLHELYGRLLDVGIRGHWMDIHKEWSTEATIHNARRIKEIRVKVKLPGLLQISDPLLLESLCLLGIGIAAAWLSLILFEVLLDGVTIDFYY